MSYYGRVSFDPYDLSDLHASFAKRKISTPKQTADFDAMAVFTALAYGDPPPVPIAKQQQIVASFLGPIVRRTPIHSPEQSGSEPKDDNVLPATNNICHPRLPIPVDPAPPPSVKPSMPLLTAYPRTRHKTRMASLNYPDPIFPSDDDSDLPVAPAPQASVTTAGSRKRRLPALGRSLASPRRRRAKPPDIAPSPRSPPTTAVAVAD